MALLVLYFRDSQVLLTCIVNNHNTIALSQTLTVMFTVATFYMRVYRRVSNIILDKAATHIQFSLKAVFKCEF